MYSIEDSYVLGPKLGNARDDFYVRMCTTDLYNQENRLVSIRNVVFPRIDLFYSEIKSFQLVERIDCSKSI